MRNDSDVLIDQVLHFDIDGKPVTLSFAQRLAQEQGWSAAYAERVVQEYKRFIALAGTTEHTVTPSKAVDAAWHLHLTYTESYWNRLCNGLLGRPLHHTPTEGGPDEADKYRTLYGLTLALYETTFQAPPPSDIWPRPLTGNASAKKSALRQAGKVIGGALMALTLTCVALGFTFQSGILLLVSVFSAIFSAIALLLAFANPSPGKDSGCAAACGWMVAVTGGTDSGDDPSGHAGGDAGSASCGSSCGGGGCGGGAS